mmetsp:Transcript_80370/g.222314  ORF Transcript_80370/g.222314 Transcript_80370/m.222314 type:complete len:234 (-) Transcript_80370:144-845(-)
MAVCKRHPTLPHHGWPPCWSWVAAAVTLLALVVWLALVAIVVAWLDMVVVMVAWLALMVIVVACPPVDVVACLALVAAVVAWLAVVVAVVVAMVAWVALVAVVVARLGVVVVVMARLALVVVMVARLAVVAVFVAWLAVVVRRLCGARRLATLPIHAGVFAGGLSAFASVYVAARGTVEPREVGDRHARTLRAAPGLRHGRGRQQSRQVLPDLQERTLVFVILGTLALALVIA